MGCVLSQLAAKFAFFPPSPPTYQIKKRDADGKLTVVSSSSPSLPICSSDDTLDVLLIDTKLGNKIVAFYLKNPCARLTLLYSHGNAADLGQLYDLFVQLKLNLRVNIMGYDYSGYGASSGTPSEVNTYADIEAVYECLETEYGVSQEDVILYGQSVGSGPTLHLAAKLPRLRGVVLHSAILSGLRVLCHVKFTFCFDIYKNIKKIRKVKCPVLVIHGTEDDVVNWLHGEGLWKKAREPYEPLWIKGGGHCNLELYPDYIRHLCRFIHEMESITTGIRLQKIRQKLLQSRSSSTTACNPIRCCKIKLRQPKCPECMGCSCLKCSWQPKCPECLGCSCLKCSWRPKCPECRGCSCLKCSWRPKCPECPGCSCLKCWWRPKCPECLGCSFLKCLWRPKCPECPGCSFLKCSLRPRCPGCCISSCISQLCCCYCKPKCPRCPRPRCSGCFNWVCCAEKSGSKRWQNGCC